MYYRMCNVMRLLFYFCIACSCFNSVLVACNEDLDVLIIGAGASGIAAASRLLQNNFSNFLILEGSDRIGGRVHTVKFGGNTIDLGGENVHGKTDNPSFDLAAPLGFLYTQNNYSGNFISMKSNGVPLNEDLSEVAKEIYDLLVAPTNTENSATNSTDSTGGKSVGDFIVKVYWERLNPLIASGKVDRKEADEFLVFLEKASNSHDGSPSWFQTSLYGDYEFVDNLEDYMLVWKGGYGYSTILDLLIQKIPNPSKELPVSQRTLLNKEVVKIDWSGPQAIVKTADGSNFTAKRVLSTVSLAVLKATANTLFSPNLPSAKMRAIQGLGIGVMDKIYLEFPYNWLPSGINGVNFVWDANDKASLAAEYGWAMEVFGFYKTERMPLTVLCGWIGGAGAEAMESATDEEVVKLSTSLLRKFSPNHNEVPNPIAMRRTQWGKDKFIRGAYSFRHIDSDTLNVGPSDLATPLNNSEGNTVLLFAGEATERTQYGTVHGAIKAGWREADRILNLQ